MKSLMHKFRLMLLGIFVSLSVGVIAQVGGGAGISAEPASTTPTFDTLTVTGTTDLQGDLSDSLGTLTVADAFRVTGASNLEGSLSDGSGALTVADDFAVTGTTDLQGDLSDSLGTLTVADAFAVTGTTDLQGAVSDSLGTLTLNDTVDVIGALTATSYGGITEANLLDKSATETVSGAWAMGVLTATSYGGITEANLLDKSATESVSGSYTFIANPTIAVATTAALYLNQTDATADEGLIRLISSSDGFKIQTRLDNDSGGENFFSITRTGQTVDTINLVSTAVQTNGADATHATGQFTDTMDTGCTTSPTLTVDWARAGDIVTLDMDLSSTCTSNALFIEFAAALPSALRPSIEQNMLGRVTDNGSVILANVAVRSDGDIAFGATTQTGIGGLTNSGTRDVVNQTVTYQLQ